MNRSILHTLWMAAALPLLLASCQQEELPDVNGASDTTPLSITVTDGGYASTDKAATRAAEDGYRTEFTDGDACGLYIVRGSTVVYDNVKLTATAGTDGSLTWQPSADVTLAGGWADEKYFLYYPYQLEMRGKTDAYATGVDGFFAPLVRDWTPEADQSTYAAYTASDLMTAAGTAVKTDGTLSLSFAMTHRMTLAVIEMPKTVYKFTDADIPDYTAASSVDFTGSSVQPYGIAPGTYRCIVNPASATASSITGSYDNGTKEFTFIANGIAGSYKTYKIDGLTPIEKQTNLRMGDYFCKGSDDKWYIIPHEATPDGNVIGIVFHAGQHSSDGADYSATGIGQEKCHGYVVALTDVGKYHWAYKEDGAYSQNAGTSTSEYDWNGYSNQKAIENFASNNTDGWKFEHFEAAYRCSIYGTEKGEDWQRRYAAPVNTSGWFLPSCNQLITLYDLNHDNANLLATSMENVKSQDSSNICWFDGYYWSSTELSQNRAWLVYFYGYTDHLSKDNASYVRPVLAF